MPSPPCLNPSEFGIPMVSVCQVLDSGTVKKLQEDRARLQNAFQHHCRLPPPVRNPLAGFFSLSLEPLRIGGVYISAFCCSEGPDTPAEVLPP